MSEKKYRKGGQITSLDQMAADEFVYIRDKITHRGWFMSCQLRYIYDLVQAGFVFRADRRADDA